MAASAFAQPAQAQTDDATPFYVGGSLGMAHVSNLYREPNAGNNDTVTSVGVLGGIDQKYGRQHVTLDGSLQNNRYSTNTDLNNRSHSIRATLNWQTIGDLSGVLSAKSDQSLADFNVGSAVDPTAIIRQKNVETNDQYQAIARLGVSTRYTLEGGWEHRKRNYTADEYGRLVYDQNTGSFGLYATPAGNVRLGLAGRHTKGSNPRYLVGQAGIDPTTGRNIYLFANNDYTRNDLDFTTRWSAGGSSTLSTRISRSRSKNGLDTILRDFSGTTGSLTWNWRPTGKLQFDVQYSRDTGQETMIRATELNRVYNSWQLAGTYELTGKLSLNAKLNTSQARRTSGSADPTQSALTQDSTKLYDLGLRWAISRSFSVSCQYDHASRDSSVAQYVYSASSFGCTGQAVLF